MTLGCQILQENVTYKYFVCENELGMKHTYVGFGLIRANCAEEPSSLLMTVISAVLFGTAVSTLYTLISLQIFSDMSRQCNLTNAEILSLIIQSPLYRHLENLNRLTGIYVQVTICVH